MKVFNMSSETFPPMAATSMGGGGMTLEDAVVLAGREADEEIRIERLGHLVGEPGADALPRDVMISPMR